MNKRRGAGTVRKTRKKSHHIKSIKGIVTLIVFLVLMISAKIWLNSNVLSGISSGFPAADPTSPAGPSKIIYLTMDMDISEWMYRQHVIGKDADWYDPNLFAYLIQNNIPATFFVSGLFAQAYPDLIRELNSAGNYAFENHAYDESSFIPVCYGLATLSTDQEKIDQIETTQTILRNLTGQIPTQFRFPGNCQSPVDDSLVRNLGFVINNGTDIAGDPFNSDTDEIVSAIMFQARANSVILMHIGGPNAPKDLDVLKQIVPELEKEGYVFEKMNE